jgi:hypothetical protein
MVEPFFRKDSEVKGTWVLIGQFVRKQAGRLPAEASNRDEFGKSTRETEVHTGKQGGNPGNDAAH